MNALHAKIKGNRIIKRTGLVRPSAKIQKLQELPLTLGTNIHHFTA